MAYPEPLEFDDSSISRYDHVRLSLKSLRWTGNGVIASLRLEDYRCAIPFYLTPTTRDALIDWLVAQREAERAAEQEKSKHGLCLLPVDGDLCELRCGHTGPCAREETP